MGSAWHKPFLRNPKPVKARRGQGSSTAAAAQVADAWSAVTKGADVTLSNGNRTATISGNTGDWAVSNTTKTSGKWYWEGLITTVGAGLTYFGLAENTYPVENTGAPGAADGMLQIRSGGFSTGGGTAGSAWVSGDIVGLAYDFATGILTAYKNGVANGTSPACTATLPLRIALMTVTAAPTEVTLRTTTAEFSYSPPTGYLPWGTV